MSNAYEELQKQQLAAKIARSVAVQTAVESFIYSELGGPHFSGAQWINAVRGEIVVFQAPGDEKEKEVQR